MTSDPLDVDAALSQLSEIGADQETKKSWNGCQKYMLRCLARRALFHSAMNTPSQVSLLILSFNIKFQYKLNSCFIKNSFFFRS